MPKICVLRTSPLSQISMIQSRKNGGISNDILKSKVHRSQFGKLEQHNLFNVKNQRLHLVQAKVNINTFSTILTYHCCRDMMASFGKLIICDLLEIKFKDFDGDLTKALQIRFDCIPYSRD